MKWPSLPAADASAAFLTFLLLAPLPVSALLQCENIQADGQKFDFSKLKGPHSVTTSEYTPPSHKNTTYTIDLCGPLKRKGDVKKGDECPNNSWVCAIKHRIRGDHDDIEEVRAIAGNLRDYGGKDLDHVATRLKTSESTSDSKKEGVRLVLKGGAYPLDGKPSNRRDQRAIIELICDPEKEGTEGEWKSHDVYEGSLERFKFAARNAEGDDDSDDDQSPARGEQQLKHENAALTWDSYGPEKDDSDVDILRLTWHTKYACESAAGGADDASKHWGFFTWMVILVFLATASYLIFGSWLNYNRYGARGWDLLPHGDTIRDVPYLLKDWVRRIINTVQGSGSRGGYSAV